MQMSDMAAASPGVEWAFLPDTGKLPWESLGRALQAERKQWSVTQVLTCLRLNKLAI